MWHPKKSDSPDTVGSVPHLAHPRSKCGSFYASLPRDNWIPPGTTLAFSGRWTSYQKISCDFGCLKLSIKAYRYLLGPILRRFIPQLEWGNLFVAMRIKSKSPRLVFLTFSRRLCLWSTLMIRILMFFEINRNVRKSSSSSYMRFIDLGWNVFNRLKRWKFKSIVLDYFGMILNMIKGWFCQGWD